MQSNKAPILILFGCLMTFLTNAQTYYQVTDTNGIQTFGSTSVTVTPIGYAGYNYACGVGPFRGNTPNSSNTGSYQYKFSHPIGVVRIHFCAINAGDTMSVQFNSQHYNITYANLSSYSGTCGLVPYCDSIVNGNIGGVTSGDNLVQFDVQPGFPIDSMQVNELAAGGAGVAWDFFFSRACPGRVTAAVLQDSICAGSSTQLFADTSLISDSATYTWTGPNGFTSALRNPFLNNATALASGTYTVVAHDTGTCTYFSSVNVTVTPIPAPVALSNSPLCPADTLNLTSDTITSAIYIWTGPNGFSSLQQNPSLTSFVAADTGYYQLEASVNGCTGYATTHVVLKKVGVPQITYNTQLCPGDTLQLNATDTTANVTFSWTGPSGFSSSIYDPIVPNMQSVNSGVYVVKAFLTGCSNRDSVAIYLLSSANPPSVFIYVMPKDTICHGQTATFTAVASGAGTTPQYQWRKNGNDIPGATGSAYLASSVNDDDSFSCRVTSHLLCQIIDTGRSNVIQMHISPFPPPLVTVSVYPPYFTPGQSEIFTGHVPSGDTGLTYQWTRNGVKIPSATNIVYTTSNLTSNDSICLIVYSSVSCTYPDSSVACIGLTLGVTSTGFSTGEVILFPNPANNVLYVHTIENVSITISGMEGKTMLQQTDARQIDISYLPDGIYMVQVFNKEGLLLKNEKLVKMKQ